MQVNSLIHLLTYLLNQSLTQFLFFVCLQCLQFFLQSRIPSIYLWILIIQFMLILLDRIIYLYRSVKAKLVLQYVLIVIYHSVLFFYLPSQVLRDCCCCCYYYYHSHPLSHSLALSLSHYSLILE